MGRFEAVATAMLQFLAKPPRFTANRTLRGRGQVLALDERSEIRDVAAPRDAAQFGLSCVQRLACPNRAGDAVKRFLQAQLRRIAALLFDQAVQALRREQGLEDRFDGRGRGR